MLVQFLKVDNFRQAQNKGCGHMTLICKPHCCYKRTSKNIKQKRINLS